MIRPGPIKLALLLCAPILLVLLEGCHEEYYFGPYALEVPSPIQERSAGRTFTMPLDKNDQRSLDNLVYCLEHEPDRQPPCRCEHRVLTVDEQDMRIDYRLTHLSGQASNVTVWIGQVVEDDAEPPALLPDMPRTAVQILHLHRLMPGQAVDDGFTEDELRQADLDFSLDRFPDCEGSPKNLPAPLSWQIGLSTAEEDPAQVSMEFTCRISHGAAP